jgi:hypothetical protein
VTVGECRRVEAWRFDPGAKQAGNEDPFMDVARNGFLKAKTIDKEDRRRWVRKMQARVEGMPTNCATQYVQDLSHLFGTDSVGGEYMSQTNRTGELRGLARGVGRWPFGGTEQVIA